MKNNNLLITAFFSVLALGVILFKDEMTYLLAALISIITMSALIHAKSLVITLTRWSKAHPRTTQFSIVVMQLLLIILGLVIGKNLRELEILMADGSIFVFSALLIGGFLLVPFRMKPTAIALPKEVERKRIGFMSITLSTFMLMILMGNRTADYYPSSPVTLAIDKIDHYIHAKRIESFTQLYYNSLSGYEPNQITTPIVKLAIVPVKDLSTTTILNAPDVMTPQQVFSPPLITKKDFRNAKKQFMKEIRKADTKNLCGLAVILIILLAITSCAGICLIIGGFGGFGSGGSVVAALLGIVILSGSIYGITQAAKWCRKERTPKQL